MDQQNQEQQKKKRPHYNNHRHKNNNGQGAGEHSSAPRAAGDAHANRQPAKGRGGEIHTRRGSFHPGTDAPVDESKRPSVDDRRELRENKAPAEHREIRENRGNHRGRGGRGHSTDNRPPRDNTPREPKPLEERPAEARGNEQKNGDNRGKRNDKNRPRRGEEHQPISEPTPRRENPPRDAEMDSWFAPAEPKVEPIFTTPAPVTTEALPHVELDLSDILPPIVMEKYSDPAKVQQPPVEEAPTAEETEGEPVASVEVIGVRFNKTGKVYYFDPNGNTARRGDAVIVETARGPEFGEVWQPNHTVKETEIVPPLRPVIRLADEKDVQHNADNARREDEAFRICLDKIKVHGLDMKLVEAQYTFDNSKLLFYFTSAGRVDFRELVKDLASVFRTRIELRQIGIRDEAKLMGGLGICGRPLCCASFLSDFTQVSIKMAQEQNLSLNSAKISGTCGRLMCCLNYEYPVYCEAARHTPSVGTTVSTPDGTGTVTETQPLAGMVKVALANAPAGTIPQYYRCDSVRVLGDNRKRQEEETAPTPDEEISEN